jgi:cytidine/deoxycytidylate deaminase-like protein
LSRGEPQPVNFQNRSAFGGDSAEPAIEGVAAMDRPIVSEIDLMMMERCVELARTAGGYGEFPFAALVCNGEGVVSEAINRVDRDADVTRHAELAVVSEAQSAGPKRSQRLHDLFDCRAVCDVFASDT